MNPIFTVEPNYDRDDLVKPFIIRRRYQKSKHSMVWSMSREDLVNLRNVLDENLSCTCSLLRNGDPHRCTRHPENKALTFDERMAYEQAHDERLR